MSIATCAAFLLAAVTTASSADAQQSEAATFVRRMDGKVLARERFTWGADSLYGVVDLPAENARFRYSVPLGSVDLARASNVWQLDVQIWRGADTLSSMAPPHQQFRLLLRPDGRTVLRVTGEHGAQTQEDVAPHDAVPGFPMAHGLLELLVRISRSHAAATQVAIPVFHAATRGYSPVAHIEFFGPDSARIQMDRLRLHLRTDAAGRLLGGAFLPPNPGQATITIEREP